MHYIVRKLWDLSQRHHTDPAVYFQRRWHRRQVLQALGVVTGAAALGNLTGCQQKPTAEELKAAGATSAPPPETAAGAYPAPRNPKFEYGRPETDQHEAAIYTNFYEFTGPHTKSAYKFVNDFQPSPWTLEVDGLCSNPKTYDLDDLYKSFAFEERALRHRCVETWAMCVPWTGFPLADLIAKSEPQPAAKYVRFETFNRPNEAPYIGQDDSFPWPYSEGLTLAEATNELAFLATGIFGEPMPKQHGAPVRLVVPWKYGFKGIKSIVKITLTDKPPATFWNTVAPGEYGFEANVDPAVPHPRWSQRTEWMLGTMDRFKTQKYNGYGDIVGALYG